MIEFFLALDEPRPEDVIIEVNGITFLADRYARQEVGSYLKVDYRPMQGFKLINKNQTLAYGVKIK
ncbi:hypothetical protein [Desertibacillus haloalkaliphilus]|uniref:hypothetical protein n=1 Tax=Desertibacillus haloalkaliphilus TaxID=1328930 RepID=UPI001C261A14|nr:hypothetical protein [Desertibacillus haloalkaliphilus]MBU8907450.1 hypothetical protein [Desertibacillus haloalkaliphilus]